VTCQEAFSKLIRNNLLLDQEKSELLNSLKFCKDTFWLKDYYQSKIEKQLVKPDKALGVVKYEVSEDEQLRLEIQFKEEALGVSPIRI